MKTGFGVLLSVVLIGSSGSYLAADEPSTNRFSPGWKEGDWWVVQSAVAVDTNEPTRLASRKTADTSSMPVSNQWYTVIDVFHRFCVTKSTNMFESQCWVVDVLVESIPSWIKDDSGGKPIYTLWLDKADDTLVWYEWRIRGGVLRVTGDVTSQGRVFLNPRDLDSRQPCIPAIDCMTPLEIPWFRGLRSVPQFLCDNAKRLEYEDPKSRNRQSQTISVMDDLVLGSLQRVVAVTFETTGGDLRIQKWVPGFPWWLTWERAHVDGRFQPGVIRARLVKWGRLGEDDKKVDTPVWW